MSDNLDGYFDEEGHLTAEGRAAYVYGMLHAGGSVPQALRDHVRDCLKCALEVEELMRLSAAPAPAKPKGKTLRFKTWHKAAAVVLMCVATIGLYLAKQRYSDQSLYAGYYANPVPTAIRGDGPAGALEKGMASYAAGDFGGALAHFAQADPKNMHAMYYKGHAHLNLGQPAQAIQAFEAVVDEYAFYDEGALFAMALAHLKNGDGQNARRCLSQLARPGAPAGAYTGKARDLLRDLDSFWRVF